MTLMTGLRLKLTVLLFFTLVISSLFQICPHVSEQTEALRDSTTLNGREVSVM